jgi:hypothetical protein
MIVTFYSFKGGVGRSMALVNVGEILADMGYRVVLCDWDLEAPGLERYLVPNDASGEAAKVEMERLLAQPGLMDLLDEHKETLARPNEERTDERTSAESGTHRKVGDLLVRRPSSYARPVSEKSGVGSLRLLTAGRRDGEHFERYAGTVRAFNWDEFYTRWAGDAYMEFFRKELVGEPRQQIPGEADLVLVDSRTGVTEQGGVCTHHLADLVVLLTAANDLNMDGSRWMAQALRQPRLVQLRGGRPLAVLPIASRIEWTAQKDELADFRIRFLREFGPCIEDAVGNAEEFALKSEIPYIPFYSFHERIVAREPPEKQDKNLNAAYQALADGLVLYGVRSGLLREPSTQGRVLSASLPSDLGEPFWDHDAFLQRLLTAAAVWDRAAVARLCQELVDYLPSTREPYPELAALKILEVLRRNQLIDLEQKVAEELLRCGQTAHSIRRLYAESLIEQGNPMAALSPLQSLASETRGDLDENAEVRGLIGRIYKQLYLAATDRSRQRSRNLEHAVNAYYETYLADPAKLWFGTNTVALLSRGRRDGLTIEGYPDPSILAHQILTVLEDRDRTGTLSPWDLATAAEACLALDLFDQALGWTVRYVGRPEIDAFELASLVRQLIEVWQLDTSSEP